LTEQESESDPLDSERERAPAAFVDDPISDELERVGKTEAEKDEVPARPVVLRTLKEPPDIWELVPQAPAHFNPGGAFLTRLAANKTNIILVPLIVLMLSGGGYFAFLKFRESNNVVTTPAKLPQSTQQTPTSRPAQPSVETPPAETNTLQSNTTAPITQPVTETATVGTKTSPSKSATGQSTAAVSTAPAAKTQPANASENTSSTDNAVIADTATTPSNDNTPKTEPRKSIRKVKPSSADKPAEVAAGAETNVNRPAEEPAAPVEKKAEGETPDNSGATRRRRATAPESQPASPTPTSSPKAKVIPWP
jgi:hypothetical protein